MILRSDSHLVKTMKQMNVDFISDNKLNPTQDEVTEWQQLEWRSDRERCSKL